MAETGSFTQKTDNTVSRNRRLLGRHPVGTFCSFICIFSLQGTINGISQQKLCFKVNSKI